MIEPRGEWSDLFRAFQMSLDPRKLWLAFRGIILSMFLVVLTVGSIACVEDAQNIRFTVEDELGGGGERTGRLVVNRRVFTEVRWRGVRQVLPTDVLQSVLKADPVEAARKTVVFARAIAWSAWSDVRRHILVERKGWTNVTALVSRSTSLLEVVALLVANGILLLLVWSYYSGAIMRIAAVEYALGERIELRSAAAYARRKHGCLFGAPFGLMVAIAAAGLAIVALGALAWNALVVGVACAGLLGSCVVAGIVEDRARSGKVGLAVGLLFLLFVGAGCVALATIGVRVPYVGEFLLAVLSPLAFLAGIVMSLLGVWALLGTGLMFASVATEDADTFQALSRSIAALCKQVWRVLVYGAVVAGYGALCVGFAYLVRIVAGWLVLILLSPALGDLVEVGRWIGTDPRPGTDLAATVLIFFLRANDLLLDLALVSFVVTLLLSSKTIVYFLLRKHSDGRPVTEVHLEPRDRRLLIAAPLEPDDEETGDVSGLDG